MMNRKIDDVIRQGLSAEDQQLYDALESDMGLQDMALSSFQGKARWMKILALVYSFAFFLIALYCVWGFVHTAEVRAALNWALGFGFSALSMGLLKLYFWMEWHKNAVLREVKRVELQLSRLAEKIC